MSERLRESIRRNKASGRQCELRECFRPVEKISRYCVHHDATESRTGHPLGHTVRVKELRPYVARTTSYIRQHKQHPAIAEAIRRTAELVYGARRRNVEPRRNATAHERVSGWLDRLERAAVQPEELLAIVAAMLLYQEAEPHAFKSARHFKHQLAVRFIRSAPAPYSPRWRGGAGSKRYDRISVSTRDLLASTLERCVGLPCLRIARILHASTNPYSPEQEAAIRAPLPPSTPQGKP